MAWFPRTIWPSIGPSSLLHSLSTARISNPQPYADSLAERRYCGDLGLAGRPIVRMDARALLRTLAHSIDASLTFQVDDRDPSCRQRTRAGEGHECKRIYGCRFRRVGPCLSSAWLCR